MKRAKIIKGHNKIVRNVHNKKDEKGHNNVTI